MASGQTRRHVHRVPWWRHLQKFGLHNKEAYEATQVCCGTASWWHNDWWQPQICAGVEGGYVITLHAVQMCKKRTTGQTEE